MPFFGGSSRRRPQDLLGVNLSLLTCGGRTTRLIVEQEALIPLGLGSMMSSAVLVMLHLVVTTIIIIAQDALVSLLQN